MVSLRAIQVIKGKCPHTVVDSLSAERAKTLVPSPSHMRKFTKGAIIKGS